MDSSICSSVASTNTQDYRAEIHGKSNQWLKHVVVKAGMSLEGVLEKSDLEQKAMQALQKRDEDSANDEKQMDMSLEELLKNHSYVNDVIKYCQHEYPSNPGEVFGATKGYTQGSSLRIEYG